MVYRRRYLSGQAATTVVIAEKAVTSDKIADKAIDTPQIADDAITSEKVRDGEIKSEDIGAQEIKTEDVKDGAITGPKIAESTIPESKMSFSIPTRPLSPGVDTVEIQDAKVTLAKLAPDSVDASKIKPGAVGESELAGNAVTEGKIKDGEISTNKYKPSSVDSAALGADSVGGTEIKTGAVGVTELGTDAVETVKIKNEAVTIDKVELDILAKGLSARQLFYDDFLGTVLDDAWRVNGDAGGVVVLDSISRVNIVTDNDNGDFYRLDWGAIHGLVMDAYAGRFIIRAYPAVLTNEVVFIGFFFGVNDFIGFRLDTSVDNNWYAVSRAGGLGTEIDTGVVATADYKKFEFLFPTPGADIKFNIDDVLKATITTNKYAGVGHVCLKIQTLENAAKTLYVDAVLVAADRSTT